ncbi:MAG: 4Fe-4S dicluster domain-containing protein [Candidatus Eisenbacteria bacterium]|nr:4Fe-4S dicluster domain-containing protein [Candidatus Eisenbacteria bacterium]
MGKGILFDVTQCVGCGACREACREANHLPETEGNELSDKSYTVVQERQVADGSRNIRRMCMHCLHPTCASVCPVGAFHKTPEGPVLYDESRCIGCRYCMMACPYGVPRYEWSSTNPAVRKCILCAPRLAQGLPTACAEACPTGATLFGDREELLKIAHERIAQQPDVYVQQVYGEEEGGGTSVLILSDVSFAELGLPVNLPGHPMEEYTEAVLSKLPNVVLVGGSLLSGLYWIINRRMVLARERMAARERAEGMGVE